MSTGKNKTTEERRTEINSSRVLEDEKILAEDLTSSNINALEEKMDKLNPSITFDIYYRDTEGLAINDVEKFVEQLSAKVEGLILDDQEKIEDLVQSCKNNNLIMNIEILKDLKKFVDTHSKDKYRLQINDVSVMQNELGEVKNISKIALSDQESVDKLESECKRDDINKSKEEYPNVNIMFIPFSIAGIFDINPQIIKEHITKQCVDAINDIQKLDMDNQLAIDKLYDELQKKDVLISKTDFKNIHESNTFKIDVSISSGKVCITSCVSEAPSVRAQYEDAIIKIKELKPDNQNAAVKLEKELRDNGIPLFKESFKIIKEHDMFAIEFFIVNNKVYLDFGLYDESEKSLNNNDDKEKRLYIPEIHNTLEQEDSFVGHANHQM